MVIASDAIGFELLQLTYILDNDLTPHLVDINRDPSIVSPAQNYVEFYDRLIDDVLKLTVDSLYGFKESPQLLSERTKFEIIFKEFFEPEYQTDSKY